MEIYSYAIYGIQRAFDLHRQGAIKVNKDEIAEGYIDMYEAVRQVKANITVIRTQDRMLKSLIDIYG